MKIVRSVSLVLLLIFFGPAERLFAQAATDLETPDTNGAPVTQKPGPSPTPTPKVGFAMNLVRDQKAIWTSPFHLKKDDLKWLVPLAAGTTALIATDRYTSGWVDHNGSLQPASHDVSYSGSAYAVAGTAAGFYVIGKAVHDERAAETGKLAAEALIDTTIVTEVLKLSTQRMRPNADDGRGLFFTHGNSFPSGHSSSVWSVSTVVACEYHDRPFIKYGAYILAAAVSMSRYSGRNHFLSEVLVGSSIGYGIGRFVYRTNH